VAVGCGKPKSAADNVGPKMAGGAKPKAGMDSGAVSVVSTAKPPQYISHFSTNDLYDPFNPQAKPVGPVSAAEKAAQNQSTQIQTVSELQKGFQGIFGSSGGHEVMVHGVLLRENHEAIVPISINGERRRVKVTPVRIYRNTAELKVEGLAQTVTVPKPRG